MAKQTYDVVETKVRELPVRLSTDEVLARGQRMAQLKQDLEELKLETKTLAKERKQQAEELEQEISSLARAIREKEEKRPVDVEVRFVGNGRILEVRTDTGETLIERAADDEEAQQPLLPVKGDA